MTPTQRCTTTPLRQQVPPHRDPVQADEGLAGAGMVGRFRR
jgi:hypothetical protein